MTRPWLIPRRTCLRGLGVALALPLLETMGWADPPKAQPFKAPTRLGFIYMSCGILPERFWPADAKTYPTVLPSSLEPLRPVLDQCLLIDRIDNVPKGVLGGEAHWYEISSWLTQATPTQANRAGVDLAISADQLAAQHIGLYTPLPSLELGTRNNVASGTTGGGTNNRYSTTANWRTPTEPLPVEHDPGNALKRLFAVRGGGRRSGMPSIDASRFQRAQPDQPQERSPTSSMLDLILASAKDLRGQVSSDDRRQLDGYLESVRGLEKRVAAIERQQAAEEAQALAAKRSRGRTRPSDLQWSDPIVVTPARGTKWSDHVKVMADIMVLAFQCDVTRVCTLIPTHDNGMGYPELGFTDRHHNLSHHRGDQAKKDKIAQIDRLHVEQLAYLVARMKTLRDGPGTLLDHSALLWSSGLGEGDGHSSSRLPTIVAGKANGTIVPGRFVQATGNQSDLLTGLLMRAGVPLDKPFGNGTKPLAELS